MATASETITAALREGNLLGINATPSTAQQTEGLVRLNSLLLATVGNEAGEELRDFQVGGYYDQSQSFTEYLPENTRLVCNLEAGRTLKLHPQPYDGQRLAVADASGNFATNNLVLDGNGRRIEGAATLTLSTNEQARQWIYRGDLGEWKTVTELILTDDLPFPVEFDDYFTILLSMRLNPRYGQELQQGSAAWLDQMANRLESRYRKPRRVQDWGSLGLLGQNRMGYTSSPTNWRTW